MNCTQISVLPYGESHIYHFLKQLQKQGEKVARNVVGEGYQGAMGYLPTSLGTPPLLPATLSDAAAEPETVLNHA